MISFRVVCYNSCSDFDKPMKTTVLRASSEFLAQATEAAKQAGLSFNAWVTQAIREKLGLTEENLQADTIKGCQAEVIIADGQLYNWNGRRRINTWKPLYLVSHGKLWLVDKTSNYSHKIVRAVSVLPQCLLDKADGGRLDFMPKLFELSSNAMLDTLAVLLELETQQWFLEMGTRDRDRVIDAAILEGWTVERLSQEYSPVVITIPQPEEVPVKLKARQLQARYGLQETWHMMVGGFKKNGFLSPDGLVWKYVRNSEMWVRT